MRDRSLLRSPDTWTTQVGSALKDVRNFTVGAAWSWDWARVMLWGQVSGYSELVFAQWRTKPGGRSRVINQMGINPTFRWRRTSYERWFVDFGVGAHYITPLYRTSEKRFSTKFNFGDHISLGYELGRTKAHEIALRLEHYSNGGIDSPNPGEEFLHLRYCYHIDF